MPDTDSSSRTKLAQIAFKKLAGMTFAESGLYKSLVREDTLVDLGGGIGKSGDVGSPVEPTEVRASVLATGIDASFDDALRSHLVSAEEDLSRETASSSSSPVPPAALCRNRLHDCIGYQHVLDRLQVCSGDLVEVSNPAIPSLAPKLARLWLAKEDDVLLNEDVKLSPFLAYDMGVAYQLQAFFTEEKGVPEFPISFKRYVPEPPKSPNAADGDGLEPASDVLIVDPSNGLVRVKLAKRVSLRAVREPDPTGDFLPDMEEEEGEDKKNNGGSGGPSEHQVNSGFDEPEEETASVCLDSYFGSDVQVVGLGDVISIPIPDSHNKLPGVAVSQINSRVKSRGSTGICLDEGHQRLPQQMLYFKVTGIWPAGLSIWQSIQNTQRYHLMG
jgi:hypothetical protein